MTSSKIEPAGRALPPALIALAVACFCIGTSEFAVTGLLPQIASDLDTSIPTAGFLVTGYALGVVVGAPILSVITTSMSRRKVLIGLLVVFIVGSVLCALAQTYPMLLTGRVIAALTQGGFHGAGVVVAADLVRPDRRGWAISLMFTGFTISNVVGVPAATAIGLALGWRAAFWAIAVAGLLAMAVLLVTLPTAETREPSNLRAELNVLRRPVVWLGLATTALGFSGVFATFTYLSPLLVNVGHFGQGSVAWLLIVVSAGLVIGNILGGRMADRALWPTVITALALLSLTSALLILAIHNKISAVVVLFLFGMCALGTVTPLQSQIMESASDAPILASAANISAFNLGNAAGAWVGGSVLAAGFGYSVTNAAGALLAAAGTGVAVIAAITHRRRSRIPVGAGL